LTTKTKRAAAGAGAIKDAGAKVKNAAAGRWDKSCGSKIKDAAASLATEPRSENEN